MDLQRTLLTEIILNMSSGGSFICDFFKKGESCLRNSQKPDSFGLLSFCSGRTLHVLPVAVLRRAKRPFGPSANPASATQKPDTMSGFIVIISSFPEKLISFLLPPSSKSNSGKTKKSDRLERPDLYQSCK